MPSDRFELADLQRLLYRLISAAGGVDEATARETMLQNCGLEALIAGNRRLSSRERLSIYANAYFYRLHDILKEDFHCTHTILGDLNFHNLITGYLVDYPPSEPSVFHAGVHLPQYLRSATSVGRISLSHWPFLADLARLERACLEVFHGADAETLEETSLRDLAPQSWPELRLRLQRSAQLLDVEWEVDGVMTAIKEARQWQAPARATTTTTILVWRQNWRVRYRTLTSREHRALKAAATGTDFASICAELADDLEAGSGMADSASIINRMLGSWLRDGLLVKEASAR